MAPGHRQAAPPVGTDERDVQLRLSHDDPDRAQPAISLATGGYFHMAARIGAWHHIHELAA